MHVGVNEIYNAVVILGILIADSPTLNHFVFFQRKLNGLNSVSVLIVGRKNDRVLPGIIFAIENALTSKRKNEHL